MRQLTEEQWEELQEVTRKLQESITKAKNAADDLIKKIPVMQRIHMQKEINALKAALW